MQGSLCPGDIAGVSCTGKETGEGLEVVKSMAVGPYPSRLRRPGKKEDAVFDFCVAESTGES
eukprot:703535-Pelagomonas_calceolata.AAC.3